MDCLAGHDMAWARRLHTRLAGDARLLVANGFGATSSGGFRQFTMQREWQPEGRQPNRHDAHCGKHDGEPRGDPARCKDFSEGGKSRPRMDLDARGFEVLAHLTQDPQAVRGVSMNA